MDGVGNRVVAVQSVLPDALNGLSAPWISYRQAAPHRLTLGSTPRFKGIVFSVPQIASCLK